MADAQGDPRLRVLGHPHAWKRTALVTDVDWIAKALHMFAWLTPGEVRLYELGGLEDAKAWVAAGGEDPA